MPFILAKPVVDENGDEYPFVTANMISAPDVQDKYIGAPTVVNLRPFRVLPDGTIILGPDVIPPLLYADAFKTVAKRPDLLPILGGIMALTQQLITAEGL